jgi:hypothetical protein
MNDGWISISCIDLVEDGMSELVWMKTMRGIPTAQIWHGPPYVGVAEWMPKDASLFGRRGLYADRVICRIPIPDNETRWRIDALMVKYPLGRAFWNVSMNIRRIA